MVSTMTGIELAHDRNETPFLAVGRAKPWETFDNCGHSARAERWSRLALQGIEMAETSANLARAGNMVGATVEIVAAYAAHNSIAPQDLLKSLADVHLALRSLSSHSTEVGPGSALVPAVPVKKSVTPDFIVCLEDGKRFKSMKRHLSLLGMTPDEYRAKWHLKSDYPMVAPNYAARRSSLAKSIGLGHKSAPKARIPEVAVGRTPIRVPAGMVVRGNCRRAIGRLSDLPMDGAIEMASRAACGTPQLPWSLWHCSPKTISVGRNALRA